VGLGTVEFGFVLWVCVWVYVVLWGCVVGISDYLSKVFF